MSAVGPKEFNILIVDDNIDLRDLLTSAVKDRGYGVAVSENGDAAVSKLVSERYDIVVTDLMMPGIDGISLLRKVKELDKGTLVILISGHLSLEAVDNAVEAGAYGYIKKPFNLNELMLMIGNACERLWLERRNKALVDELRYARQRIASLEKDPGKT